MEDIDRTYDVRKRIADMVGSEEALPASRSQAPCSSIVLPAFFREDVIKVEIGPLDYQRWFVGSPAKKKIIFL